MPNIKKAASLLRAENIKKAFYGNVVLNDISFSLDYGKVLGLIGQNGAGKSTLVKILTGAYQLDSGTIYIEEESVSLCDINAANEKGIAIVFQELSLAANMTVADNIYVGRLPKNKFGLVDREQLYKQTENLIAQFEVDIKPDDKIEKLSIGKRQIVEIIKAVSKNPKVLILDEPTSSLEEAEIKVLFKFIRTLKKKDFSIIYISHHMSEIFEIVDEILILRDGIKVKECHISEIDVSELISLMIGKKFESYSGMKDGRRQKEEKVIEVKNLCLQGKFSDISFDIHKGEVLGISGIIGSGKTELCEAMYGLYHFDGGELLMNGNKIKTKTPSESKKQGILFIPENRKTQGLFLNDTVQNNMIACTLKKVCTKGILSKNKINKLIEKYQISLNVKMISDKQIIRFLSGGNQQKVLVAKCIADDPRLLIAMDPTRGIDVASKADIHKIVHELSEEGLSVMIVSSELEELMIMCDRIIVMNSGKLIDSYQRENFDESKILLSMHKAV